MTRKNKIKELRKKTSEMKPILQKLFGKNGTPEYGKLLSVYKKLQNQLRKLLNEHEKIS